MSVTDNHEEDEEDDEEDDEDDYDEDEDELGLAPSRQVCYRPCPYVEFASLCFDDMCFPFLSRPQPAPVAPVNPTTSNAPYDNYYYGGAAGGGGGGNHSSNFCPCPDCDRDRRLRKQEKLKAQEQRQAARSAERERLRAEKGQVLCPWGVVLQP